MSDAVETVRAALDALHTRGAEGVVEYVSPDFEGTVGPDVSAEPDEYVGHEGVRRYFALFDEVVEGLRFEIRDIDAEGEWVVADVEMSGRGRGSGVPMEMRVVLAAIVRDGLIQRMAGYADRDSARAAISGGAT
jgi:ketosteroid isomerase-like protein